MIRPQTCFLLLFLLVVSKCQQKDVVGLTTDIYDEPKNAAKASSIEITKSDLDWEQIEEQRHKKPVEVPKTLGIEFVPEKLMDTMSEEAFEQSNPIFLKGMSFVERGKGHGRDGKLAAFKLFEQAAALGHVESRKLIAFSYLFGDFSRWSIEEAKNIFNDLKKSGSADSQLALGFMHATGVGMEKSDQAKAIVHYTFAALGGNPLAQMAMGYRYHTGVGVPQNCETALSFYEKVAKKVAESVKYTTSPNIQRVRLNDESDPTIDLPAAATPLDTNLLEYYKMLADKGDLPAQAGLGTLYLSGGRGIQQNFELAYKHFSNAAQAGNVDAYVYLGKMHLDGTPFTPQDDEKAFEYFLKAADKSNPSAMAALGIMYYRGRGVKKNYEKALKLLTMAADKKNIEGQLYLGILNYKGVPTQSGIKRDFQKAVKLFQLASQGGNVLSYYHLAQMHATGTGVPRSCAHAVELYKSVAERGRWGEKLMEAYSAYKSGRQDEAAMKYMFMAEIGYETAQSNLAFILDHGEATSLFSGERHNNLQRALVNWQRSANQDYAMARIKLGDYYYYGYGTEVDHSMAFSNYKLAVDRHAVAQAMFNLGYMHEIGEGISKDLYLAKRYYDQAMEQSSDAVVPARLALAKLAVVFYLEELNKLPIFQVIESSIGPNWDLILMALFAGVLLIFVIRYLRPN